MGMMGYMQLIEAALFSINIIMFSQLYLRMDLNK
jgi:hypothetical protein